MSDNAEPPPTKKKGYRCYFCGEKFLDIKELKKHISAHKDRPYECEICDRTFSAEFTLQKHMLVHTKEKPFMCEKCGRAFNQKWNLMRHIERHDAAESKNKVSLTRNHSCRGCEKGARYPSILCSRCTFHGKRIREDGKYFCALCYLVFENIATLNSHVLEHRVCDKKRLQRAATELHYDCFRCSICKLAFRRELNYNKHILKCGKEKKKYPPRRRNKPKLLKRSSDS